MLEREYSLSSDYINNNLIVIEEINNKQNMYFIKLENNEILQVLVQKYPFEYRIQSSFEFNNRAGADEWFISNGRRYQYHMIRYRPLNHNNRLKSYAWIIDGVLYDDNIKNVVVNNENCKIIDLQVKDENLRYFYYIYPEKLRKDELPQESNDIPIDFIY